MWREQILRLYPDSIFSAPAALSQLQALEAGLRVTLPAELRGLLLETNGVTDYYGLGIVWKVERIHNENLLMRQDVQYADLYMPFDCLLFFADAGNGDQFAYSIIKGEIKRRNIYAWDHEDDTRRWVAPSLEKYLEWWLQGIIKL